MQQAIVNSLFINTFVSNDPGKILKSSSKESKESFQSILDRKASINSTKDQNRNENEYDRSYDINQNQLAKNKFEIAKQAKIKEALRKSDNKDALDENSAKETKVVTKDTMDDKQKFDLFLDTVSDVLGVNKDEMKNLLDSLKIQPETLNSNTLDEMCSLLSQKLGLNQDQTQALKQIFEGTLAKINQILQNPEIIDNIGNLNKDWIFVQHKNLQVQVLNNNNGPSEEFISKLKQGLDDISKISDTDAKTENSLLQTKITDIIDSRIKVLMDKSKDQKAIDVQNDEKQTIDSDQDNQKNDSADAMTKVTGGDAVKAKTDSDLIKTESTVSNSNNDGQLNTTNANVDVNIIGNKLQNLSNIKNDKPVFVDKNNLFEQIVDKAKAVINQDKSEMMIDLKPDSLGKLNLQIVTERGMVVAKFIAENHQVKEVLESNMQLLKDSLEKQGLSVQSCSVSVGQNNQKNSNFRNSSYNYNRKDNDSIQKTSGIAVDFDDAKIIANPYNWDNGSNINLTA